MRGRLRRLVLALVAWRWVLAPVVHDPPRDPSLRSRYLTSRLGSLACDVCGQSGTGPAAAPLEVEHTRPKSFGGSDDFANLQLACRPCHACKSRAEHRVRAVNRRIKARIPSGRPSPRIAAGLVVFATGVVTSRWAMWALLILAALCWGPPSWRSKRPWFTGHSTKATGGANNYSDFDRRLEESSGGGPWSARYRGRMTRRYWRGRDLAYAARYLPMMVLGVYLAGVATRSYGWDVAALTVRVLAPV